MKTYFTSVHKVYWNWTNVQQINDKSVKIVYVKHSQAVSYNLVYIGSGYGLSYVWCKPEPESKLPYCHLDPTPGTISIEDWMHDEQLLSENKDGSINTEHIFQKWPCSSKPCLC